MACVPSAEWTGKYETDFQRLLPGLTDALLSTSQASDSSDGDFSLVSGSYRIRQQPEGRVTCFNLLGIHIGIRCR